MFDFGLRLKQLRTSHNLSQEYLAKKINKSPSVVSGYENNVKTPPLDVLISLAMIYNVSLDYLVGIEKKDMISIENLTETQKRLVNSLLLEFSTNKSKENIGLSQSQQQILNDLIVEFTSK